MKVILKKDIPNLGEEGDVKVVADGYARNYLLPNQMVMACTKQNLKVLEQSKSAILKRKEEKRKNALNLKERLESEEIVLTMPAGDTGKLFGSVNNAMIAEALDKIGLQIERKRIEIPDHHIKMVGNFKVKVKLYESQFADLKILINKAE